jgi:hypothetical protein
MKTEIVKVRIEEKEKEELIKIAATLDVPFSQIAREGIRERISELRRTHPLLIETQPEPALAE